MEAALSRINSLPAEEAAAELLKCCGSARWAARVAAARPFGDSHELHETAERVWWEMGAEDWLEAIRAHPKIGERKAQARVSEEASRWSEGEQSGARAARPEVLDALAEANRAYEEKFGHIFIVCATGKTAGEMLALLRERMANEPGDELRVAALEQSRITRLRLEKLLSE
ncbi:MAG TPA: 2-oxo-4-hydroxy-4-carboxy-5-ureidoimidazoline decarboxylase [Pyrinomonadaceae bacterium]|nr:2-oxo-4-hydroxy-4-carboxy-5-ureidoimidazoline decarboxylase [Pyrinomonadaceae bacterium]